MELRGYFKRGKPTRQKADGQLEIAFVNILTLASAAWPKAQLRKSPGRDHASCARRLVSGCALRCCRLRSTHFGAGPNAWCASSVSREIFLEIPLLRFLPTRRALDSPVLRELEIQAFHSMAPFGSTGRRPGRCRNRKLGVPCP